MSAVSLVVRLTARNTKRKLLVTENAATLKFTSQAFEEE